MKRLLTIALLAAACGGGSKKPDTTANTTASSTTTAVLELGELKLIDVSKNEAVLIHTSGDIDYPDLPVKLKVTPDGKLLRSDTGEVGFQLMPDGTLNEGKGNTAIPGITLTADGTLTVNGKTITIDANGALVGANPDAPQMKIEGATTPGLKRTALFVMVAFSAGGPESGEKHEGSAPAPTP